MKVVWHNDPSKPGRDTLFLQSLHLHHQQPASVSFTANLRATNSEGVGNEILVRFEEVAARECPYVMALRVPESEGHPAATLLTVTGCLGMAGMNASRVGIAINNLGRRPRREIAMSCPARIMHNGDRMARPARRALPRRGAFRGARGLIICCHLIMGFDQGCAGFLTE